MHAIESSDRLWEVEEILQRRGQGLPSKHVKKYLVQWTPSLLSAKELRYARKTWKIIKTLQGVRIEKGGAHKIKVQWSPSWVPSLDFGRTNNRSIGACELLF